MPDFPSSYPQFIERIKSNIRLARLNSLRAINRETVELYYKVGNMLAGKVAGEGWGQSVVVKISQDIQTEFPGIKGFSTSNLWRMKAFFEELEGDEKLAAATREIGWTHNYTILEKVKNGAGRKFYMDMCRDKGWSVSTLIEKIRNDEFGKSQLFQSNFEQTLPPERMEQVRWQFKDEYNMSLVGLREEVLEKEMEEAMVKNIVKLLADMGRDFTFAGRQYRLEIAGDEVFIDLLFYHRRLRCFVAVELKATEFDFRDMGQIQGYLQALDEQVCFEDENPSIGIIICRSKNRTKVEYALRASTKPVGVATYTFNELPETFSKYLPSEEELQQSLTRGENTDE
jgi:predicted nuclease of restriction endonuclease-like (RecB) superfamily